MEEIFSGTWSSSFGLVHRTKILETFPKNDDKIKVSPLFAYDDFLQFDIFIVELLPGCDHLSPPHQKKVVEHGVVVLGEMEVLVEGMWHLMKQHEGLRFNVDIPYEYLNLGEDIAVFNAMLHCNYAL